MEHWINIVSGICVIFRISVPTLLKWHRKNAPKENATVNSPIIESGTKKTRLLNWIVGPIPLIVFIISGFIWIFNCNTRANLAEKQLADTNAFFQASISNKNIIISGLTNQLLEVSNKLQNLQRRFDAISDALAKANSLNKAPAGDTIGNSRNSAIIHSLVSNGNMIIASDGATINQTITNSLPKPYVSNSERDLTNSLENGVFKNIYYIQVVNPAPRMILRASGVDGLASLPHVEFQFGGTVATQNGMIPWKQYTVTLLTSNMILDTNVQFSVETAP
jgi:hypothetical protein